MKIAFHGAARTVTGSKHLLTLSNGKKYLLDCGMFQGMGKETEGLNREFGFDAAGVDYLILSHAHMDLKEKYLQRMPLKLLQQF
jgi:metallo-beta-lactamase family protein